MKVLITGGCGFVGAALAIELKQRYPTYTIICFDNLKRRGSELSIEKLKKNNITFMHGDIRNEEDFDGLRNIQVIIDCSAEPSVLAGLNGGQRQLLNINLIGTLNIINLALSHSATLLFLSTSRVYPVQLLNEVKFVEEDTRFSICPDQNLPGITEKGVNEEFPLNGYKSLYGASKLASELIMQEYEHFFDLNVIINRCGVIAGPGQMGKVDQGVIVLWVARHYWKKELGYFGFGGTGKQVRDVLFIEDLSDLVDLQIHNPELFRGQIFNVGGGRSNSTSLLELTQVCENVVGNKIKITPVIENRSADIRSYITDNTKIQGSCDWTPISDIQKNVNAIFEWIRSEEKMLKPILS